MLSCDGCGLLRCAAAAAQSRHAHRSWPGARCGAAAAAAARRAAAAARGDGKCMAELFLLVLPRHNKYYRLRRVSCSPPQ
jgi:hypothetical protein